MTVVDHSLRRLHNTIASGEAGSRHLALVKSQPHHELCEPPPDEAREWKMLGQPQRSTPQASDRSCGVAVPRAFSTRGIVLLIQTEGVISSHYRQVRERLAAHPQRWLVTGVAGFIGSNLLDELLSLGQSVVGLDNFSTGHRSNIEEVLAGRPHDAHRFTLVEGDIRDPGVCHSACAGANYILHHAALASVPKSIEAPLLTHAVNVDGFANLLLAARDAKVDRFIYASSSAVYGDATAQPQIEKRTGRALSPYAAHKAMNESYATAFQLTYGLESIGLRYYNIFGKRQDPDGAYAAVIPRWITQLIHGDRCVLFGDGETTRDFCHVANVVQANILAALATDPQATGQVYNIGSSESLTLRALFELIREQLTSHYPSVAFAQPEYLPFRAGDIRRSSGSVAKARRMIGFVPSHDVRDGLIEAIPWYLAQRSVSRMSEPPVPSNHPTLPEVSAPQYRPHSARRAAAVRGSR